jgi:hypothetical protein
MRPVWLIEAGVYGVEAVLLRAEIGRQGMAVDFVPHQALKFAGYLRVRRPLLAGRVEQLQSPVDVPV